MSIVQLRSCLDLGARPWVEREAAPSAVVAIPACNEDRRIADCLSALAVQRTAHGAPLARGTFDVLVLANNCTDRTAEIVRAMELVVPYRLHLAERHLPPHLAHAGGARKAAMDLAADRLAPNGAEGGLIMTTDADSRVTPCWVDATLKAFSLGVDAVAGYVDPEPGEYVSLGPTFLQRGRLEDTYLTALAELDAICDPLSYDPWPNHRVASGASLAVTVSAYRAIGGLPPVRLGEDAALVRALEHGGFRVRHSLAAVVTTSCRFDGRAQGGAADTMRLRHAEPEAFCSDDIEPALRALHRSVWKGRLRRLHAASALASAKVWDRKLGLAAADAAVLRRRAARPFAELWATVEDRSIVLRRRQPLRPSDLPRETTRAARIIALLRRRVAQPPKDDPADRPRAAVLAVSATA